MKITIKDIAEHAGVAKSTVSRYLNGGQVSTATAEKLKQVIEKFNYEPNAFAQSLKAKRTNFVGIVAPTLDSFMTSRLLMTIDEELKRHQVTAMIMSTNQHAEREVDSLLNFARQKVDAIILITKEVTPEHERVITSINLPVLLLGQETTTCKCIVYDDYHAGYSMGQYIAAQGHTRIAYLGVDSVDVAVGVRRRDGVLDALRKAGIEQVALYETGFLFEDGEQMTRTILAEGDPTVIICATDNLALGAIKTIVNSGRRFPEDISLSGFGGYDVSSAIHPSLTTIRFEMEETGVLTARSILQLINGEYVPQMQRTGYRLIEGHSVRSMNEK